MDQHLINAVANAIPPINQTLLDGYAVKEMEYAEAFIDRAIRDVEKDFPEGLTYVDFRRMTPLETYMQMTEEREGRSVYEVARSDIYMIQLNFDYKGRKITKPLFLPFLRDGGLMSVRGATFAISPILADKGISFGEDSAFVHIPRARLRFKRLRHHFIATIMGVENRRQPVVIYSQIHNLNKKRITKSPTIGCKLETTLAHYLFAKYGIVETFKRFLNSDIHIGDIDEINVSTYPPDEWVICQSYYTVLDKDAGKRTRVKQQVSQIRLAIRACDWETVAESMIAAFFYLVDSFPLRILPEYLDGSEHEIRLWRVLLGIVIGGISGGEGSIKEAIDEHIQSLDYCLDSSAREELAHGEVFVEDIYQLLYHMIEVLSKMTIQTSNQLSSMYNKRLMVLRYVLRDVCEGIVKLLFRLMKSAQKKELTYEIVRKDIQRCLKTDAILAIKNSKNNQRHTEVNTISAPEDNKFFKITSNIVLQSDSGGRSKTHGARKLDKSKFLHASIAEVASYGVLPKSEPTGRSSINPWVQTDADGSIIRNPKHADVIQRTQKFIDRED